MSYAVFSIPHELADEVRRTHVSPGYGHAAQLEMARGTGPCRCCLQPFEVGRDSRLLFTYRPAARDGTLMAPGPVFIHAEHCRAFSGAGFPEGLRALPLAFEARAAGSRVTELVTGNGLPPEAQIERLFASAQTEWIHLRHAEAGCFIARIERADTRE